MPTPPSTTTDRHRTFGALRVHEDLVKAQESGELVVFAGAGVSAGPPSRLPGFEGLITNIEEWSDIPRRTSSTNGEEEEEETVTESFENYLGRLEDRDVAFREKVREKLSREDSQPTDLHYDLLRLFSSPESVRVVTTNFDLHFSAAAQEVFGTPVERFEAPALPLGNDFSGIVHLHGSLRQPNRRLVLTDADFSRAYLTEGWARRFVQQLFSEYVVLFVGYSHGDDVMRYLARGIPPDRDEGRYAFEKAGSDSVNWDYYNVEVAEYPEAEDANSHAELPRAIGEWVDRTTMLPSEYETYISEILDGSPKSLDNREKEELEAVLRNGDQVQFFTSHASSIEWIEWVAEHGHLDPLFRPEPLEEHHKALDRWLISHIGSHPERLMALFSGHPRRWNRTLVRILVARLYALRSDGALPSSTISSWMRLTLQNMNGVDETLPTMLSACEYPNDTELAFLLFRYLTRPEVSVRVNMFPWPGEDDPPSTFADVDFRERGSAPFLLNLRETWKEFFVPRLEEFWAEAETIVTNRIEEFYNANSAFYGKDGVDPFLRQWVDVRKQKVRVTSPAFMLMDAAKDLMDWVGDEDLRAADRLIHHWSHSRVPILKTLSVYGVRHLDSWNADKKTEWLLERNWILHRQIAGEAERLIVETYRECSDPIRQQIHQTISQRQDEFDRQDQTYRLRRVRDLLLDLQEAVPNCMRAQDAVREFGDAHPELMQELEDEAPHHREEEPSFPGLDPEDDLAAIVDAFDDAARARRRRDAEEELEQILRSEPEWGVQLAEALIREEKWDADAWTFLIRVFRRVQLSDNDWGALVNVYREHEPLHQRHAEEIIWFLSRKVSKREGGIPEPHQETAIELMDALRFQAAAHPPDTEQRLTDRLRRHPLHEVILFYHMLFAEGQITSEPGLPDAFRERIEEMLAGDSDTMRKGTAFTIARRAAQLFDEDETWFRETVFPLFSWDDKEIATVTWTGVLDHGSMSDVLIQELRDAFVDTFQHMDDQLGEQERRNLAQIVGRACIRRIVDPMEENWLDEFVNAAEEDDRILWARRVQRFFHQGLTDAQIQHAWDDWIEEYWRRRGHGVPQRLSAVEAKTMVKWIPHLGSVYPDAVDLVIELSPNIAAATPFSVYYDLDTENLPARYPRATLRFLDFLFDRVGANWLKVEDLLRDLADQDLPRGELEPVFEKAIDLGAIDTAFKQRHLLPED